MRVHWGVLVVGAVVLLAVGIGIGLIVTDGSGDDAAPDTAADPSPSGLTVGDVESAAIQHLIEFTERFPQSDEAAAMEEGYEPYCEPAERTDDGWLARCGFRHPDGRQFPRLFDLSIADDGTVSAAE